MIAHSSRPRPTHREHRPTWVGPLGRRVLRVGHEHQGPDEAAITIGTLTRKTEPHQNLASKRPPAIGPMAMPSPIVPAQTPMARARSVGSRKTSLTIDSDEGSSVRRPAPMTARNAIRTFTDPENAAPIDPRAKTVKPIRKSRLRPNRSARLPPTSNSPANTIA